MSEANAAVERLVKPLNEKQIKALEQFSTEWSVAPLGMKSATLLALRDRGLLECKMVRPMYMCINLPYTSFAYHWRKVEA